MKIPAPLAVYLTVAMAVLLQSADADYRYRIRGPPHPPKPPSPPPLTIQYPGKHALSYVSKTKYHHSPNYTPRIISSPSHGMAPPNLNHEHSPPFRFKGHSSSPYISSHPYSHHVGGRPTSFNYVYKPSTTSALLHSSGGHVNTFKETFRAPMLKEPFYPPASPTHFEYSPSPTPVHPTVETIVHHHPHPLASDDDKGPIHTIPAPNLSLSDKPQGGSAPYPSSIYGKRAEASQTHELTQSSHDFGLGANQGLSENHGFVLGANQGLSESHGFGLGTNQGLSESHGFGLGASQGLSESHGFGLGANQGLAESHGFGLGANQGLSESHGFGLGANQGHAESQAPIGSHLFPSGDRGGSFGTFGTTSVNIQPSKGYQVHENTNDQTLHTSDGKPVYFAPDPDPSLPAPKIPATSDPHSLPSNGRSPEELYIQHIQSQGSPLQIFETNTDVTNGANSLTSQDLYHLLQGALPQQQQLLDSYGLPLIQQPQLQQHFLQQASGLPEGFHHEQGFDNSLTLKTIRDDFHPQFQTFNYEETESRNPHFITKLVDHYTDDEEGAENNPEPTVIRSTQESTGPQHQHQKKSTGSEAEAAYHGDEAQKVTGNLIEDDESDGKGKTPPASFYSNVAQGAQLYTTLPNREAAETLATLAAAGNIHSNFINKVQKERNTPTPNRGDIPPEVDEDYSDDENEEEEYEGTQQTQRPPQQNKQLPMTYLQQQKQFRQQQLRTHKIRDQVDLEVQRPVPQKLDVAESEQQEVRYHPAHVQQEVGHGKDEGEGSRENSQQGETKEEEGREDSYEDSKEEADETQFSTSPNLKFGARIRPKRDTWRG